MASNNEALSKMQLACEEREDFAALLEGLSPEQWEQPSLCKRWRVRDVVAHVLSYDELTRWGLVRRFATGGFLPNRVNAVGVAGYACRSPEQLTELMRACIKPRGLTAGFGGMIALVDGMIHQQDIRRPLGIPRTIPAERTQAVLNCALTAPLVRGARRARGVRLVATDLDWSHGNGPEVGGTGEALLMAMAARPDALNDLAGVGKSILAQRIASTCTATVRHTLPPATHRPSCPKSASASTNSASRRKGPQYFGVSGAFTSARQNW